MPPLDEEGARSSGFPPQGDLVNYSGPSMLPTFRPGDGLIIEPYASPAHVRAGDVVLFIHPRKGYEVVHRVVRIAGATVATRGDNNRQPDPYLVAAENLLGKVVGLQRAGWTITVTAGVRGLARHYALRLVSLLLTGIARIVRPIYLGVAARGWFRGWYRAFLDVRCVMFRRPEGVEYQMVWRRRCLAIRRAGQTTWQVRFPFRLFLDLDHIDQQER